MFDPIPQEQWLTAQEIFNALSGNEKSPSYRRVQEVLNELRKEHKDLSESERPYRQLGQAFLYHPDFLKLVEARKTTRGKEPDSNKK